jgi:hypothetical protein
MNASYSAGKTLAGLANKQVNSEISLTQDSGDNVLITSPVDDVTFNGYVSLNAKVIGTSSFYLDHPVYGDIDSSTLHLDGDYASTSVLYSSITV